MKNERHGMFGTREYNTWHNMKQRCLNKNHKNFKDYGYRGITICDKWLRFNGFYEDMGDRPEGMTLERIDNNKGYYKGNCKWVSYKDQCRNRRMPINNTSKHVGVAYRESYGKYYANIGFEGKRIHLGYFKNFEEAVKARKEAELKYWGK